MKETKERKQTLGDRRRTRRVAPRSQERRVFSQGGQGVSFRCCRDIEQDDREPSLGLCTWRSLVPWTSVSGDPWVWKLTERFAK